ncbi:hypothetical protein [uncultured Winogradskyella sp.]|uniref:hypothetical protein n=1 Tax=uncultured Winogradskyella sp. TaxID=395353 RepID=UPI00260DDD0E|nr:hypothetical protein [uncultured Winogradskyella sp.]
MKELQEILKYTKDLVEQEPEKSAYWHYNKLVSKIEEVIDVIQCCKSDSEQLHKCDIDKINNEHRCLICGKKSEPKF